MSDFPTEQNPQFCKNSCGTKIYLSNKKNKSRWLPYELGGAYHDCPNKPGLDKYSTATTTTTTSTSQQENNQSQNQREMTIQQLKTWLKRLDDVGVHIDINEILKPNPKKDQEQK
jgi:hypothetical protein